MARSLPRQLFSFTRIILTRLMALSNLRTAMARCSKSNSQKRVIILTMTMGSRSDSLLRKTKEMHDTEIFSTKLCSRETTCRLILIQCQVTLVN